MSQDLWVERRARFEALRLALIAEETWGPLKQSAMSVDSSDWLKRRLSCAADAGQRAEIAARHQSALAAHDRELERHTIEVWDPLCAAGLALARTPAPDLEALRFKQAVLSDCLDLSSREQEEGELFSLFMADVNRLAEGGLPSSP